jgi:predicted nucleotidyltransferase
LFGHPDEKFYLRQVARLTSAGLGAVQRELASLERTGIVKSSRLARSVFFQANHDCPIFPELLTLVTKTMGAAAPLRTALQELGRHVQLAFIFGSLATGEHDASSDIDIFIIGDARTHDVMAKVEPLQRSLRREINPVVMPVSEFQRKLAARNAFVADVIRGRRIFLVGNDHDLERLAGGRVAEKPPRQQGTD